MNFDITAIVLAVIAGMPGLLAYANQFQERRARKKNIDAEASKAEAEAEAQEAEARRIDAQTRQIISDSIAELNKPLITRIEQLELENANLRPLLMRVDMLEREKASMANQITVLQSERELMQNKLDDLVCENASLAERVTEFEELLSGSHILVEQLQAARIEPAYKPPERRHPTIKKVSKYG